MNPPESSWRGSNKGWTTGIPEAPTSFQLDARSPYQQPLEFRFNYRTSCMSLDRGDIV